MDSISDIEYTNSRKQTESLTKPRKEQFPSYNINNGDIETVKNQIKSKNLQLCATSLQEIILDLPAEKARLTQPHKMVIHTQPIRRLTSDVLFKCL